MKQAFGWGAVLSFTFQETVGCDMYFRALYPYLLANPVGLQLNLSTGTARTCTEHTHTHFYFSQNIASFNNSVDTVQKANGLNLAFSQPLISTK